MVHNQNMLVSVALFSSALRRLLLDEHLIEISHDICHNCPVLINQVLAAVLRSCLLTATADFAVLLLCIVLGHVIVCSLYRLRLESRFLFLQ